MKLPRCTARATLGVAAATSILLTGVTSTAVATPSATTAPTVAVTDSPSEVSWAAAPANTALGSGRAHFTYGLDPGTQITDAFAVVNRSTAPITLKLYASDAFTTTSGTIDLLPATDKPRDAGSWIALATNQVTLAPQQSSVIPFTVTVPAGATPGDHSAGIVTSLVAENGNGPVSLDRRLGSRVYLRVAGVLNPTLRVSDIHADYDGTPNPVSGGPTDVRYTVTNVGNVRLKAHQSVQLTGPLGLPLTTAEIEDLPELLPGDSITRTASVGGAWPVVHVSAKVKLSPFASDDIPPVQAKTASATAGTWAWPWSQALVILVIAALIYGALALRRRRRQAVDAAVAAAVASALNQKTTTKSKPVKTA
jgi:hypothetical protein